jgi:hypothetical protein
VERSSAMADQRAMAAIANGALAILQMVVYYLVESLT